MAEQIKFYFDPGCPWCYVTSKWAKRLEELGEVELSWGIFSLEVQNAANKGEEVTELTGRSAAALRTAVALRQSDGDKAVGKFYAAIGSRFWDNAEALNEPDTIRAALTDIGADPALYDKAIEDESTSQAIIDEHHDAVSRWNAFGVPTIVLDGGDGPQFFGPVISEVPADDVSVEMLRHVLWMTRQDGLYELKRGRTRQPDLEVIRRFRARREQEQREQAQQQS